MPLKGKWSPRLCNCDWKGNKWYLYYNVHIKTDMLSVRFLLFEDGFNYCELFLHSRLYIQLYTYFITFSRWKKPDLNLPENIGLTWNKPCLCTLLLVFCYYELYFHHSKWWRVRFSLDFPKAWYAQCNSYIYLYQYCWVFTHSFIFIN